MHVYIYLNTYWPCSAACRPHYFLILCVCVYVCVCVWVCVCVRAFVREGGRERE